MIKLQLPVFQYEAQKLLNKTCLNQSSMKWFVNMSSYRSLAPHYWKQDRVVFKYLYGEIMLRVDKIFMHLCHSKTIHLPQALANITNPLYFLYSIHLEMNKPMLTRKNSNR